MKACRSKLPHTKIVVSSGSGYAVVSASALLLRGGTPGAPSGPELKRLLMRAPLELLVYRPALVLSRLR